jgi:hypothetical protein
MRTTNNNSYFFFQITVTHKKEKQTHAENKKKAMLGPFSNSLTNKNTILTPPLFSLLPFSLYNRRYLSLIKNPFLFSSTMSSQDSHQTQMTRGEKIKFALSSWENFSTAMEVEGTKSSLKNVDLLPTPPARRIWNWVSFFAYWFSESWAIATWTLGSTMILIGMTVAESIVTVFFGNLILSVCCVINSRAASVYHNGYPVWARTVFGIYAHYFFVVLRAILGIIWVSENTMQRDCCL